MKNSPFQFAHPGAGVITLWLCASFAAHAQTPSAVTVGPGKLAISINNGTPKLYANTDIGGLPHTAIVLKGQNGRNRKYGGVALYDLLESAGMETGGEQRPAALTTYLWVESADGYRVLFSGAEVHRYIGAGEVILADTEDGQAIPKAEGPYRLIVVSDKVRARWMRQVHAIYVIQLPAPPVPSQ